MSAGAAMIRRPIRTAAIVSAAMTWAAASGASDPEDLARVRRAISYLEDRQDQWARSPKSQRGEGADRTTCVSCHTGVSFALARAELVRLAATPGEAAPGSRTVAEVGRRVEHWAELDSPRFRLMYDGDQRKKSESRGTEAVLNALVLARDDATLGRADAGAITRAALRNLWATQATEGDAAGSWDWLDFGLEPWEADGSRCYGAALAAIAVGSAPGYLDRGLDEAARRGVRSLRDYIRRRFPEETLYNRLEILEASTTFEGLLSADQRSEVIDQLLAVRRDDGGWALADLGPFKRVDGSPPERDADGYATGLVLHVLLRTGWPSERPELARGLDWLRARQRGDGSWSGVSANKQRDPASFVGQLMSDAATATAARALAAAGSQ